MSRVIRGIVPFFVLVMTTGAGVVDLDQAGRTAYARGDYAAAESAFSRAIAQSPGDALLRYHRAAALTQLGRWDDAIAEYERVLKLRPIEEVATASRSALRDLRRLSGPAPPRHRNDEDEATVRLERWSGGWIAEVVINSGVRARFLVDTGASITGISPELAENLGIAPGRPPLVITLQTMSGETKAPVVSIATLRVGEVEARDVAAVVHEMPPGLDGILGNTFLGRYSVTVNARQGLLTVKRR